MTCILSKIRGKSFKKGGGVEVVVCRAPTASIRNNIVALLRVLDKHNSGSICLSHSFSVSVQLPICYLL